MTKIPHNEIKSRDSKGSQQSQDNGAKGIKRSNSVADSSSKSKSSGDIASKNPMAASKGKSGFARKSQKNLRDNFSEVGHEPEIDPPKPKGSMGPKKGNSKLSLMDSHGSKQFSRRDSLVPPSKSNSKKQSESEMGEPEIMQEDLEEEMEEEEVPMESQNYSSMAKNNMKKMPKIQTDSKQKKHSRKMMKKIRTTMSYKGIYNQFADLDDDKNSAYNFDDMFGTVIHERMGLLSKKTNKSSHVSLWSTHKDPLQKLDEEADELLQSVDRSMRNFSLSRASSGAPSTLYGQSSMNGPTLKAMMNLISVNEFLPRSMTHYSNRGKLLHELELTIGPSTDGKNTDNNASCYDITKGALALFPLVCYRLNDETTKEKEDSKFQLI